VGDEVRDQRDMPAQQLKNVRSSAVAQPQPHDLWRRSQQNAQPMEVIILGNENQVIGRRKVPDGPVRGSSQSG
jgi:hypothetical protein